MLPESGIEMEEELGHGDFDDREIEGIKHAPWRSLFNFTIKNHTVPLLIALFLSIVSGIVMPAMSIFLGKLFNSFAEFGGGKISGQQLLSNVSIDCIALVGIGAAGWLFNGGFFMFWLVFGELQAQSVRKKLFDGLMQKDMEWYDMRKNGVGGLIPRLQSQIRDLQMATSQPLGALMQQTVTALTALGVAFFYSWNLTLVTLATFPLAAAALSFISARIQPRINSQEEQLAQAVKFSSNAISAIETVKCFNGQNHESDRYADRIKEAAKHYLVQAHGNALQIGLVRLFTLGMFVQGFWYGSTLVGKSDSAGDVVTTFWSALMATQAIEQILPQMIVLEKGRAAGAALKTVIFRMERGRKIKSMTGKGSPAKCLGDINFHNVSFMYPARQDQWALKNATLFFPAGEMTFVVGGSGSGKSTIGNLLMRYYTNWTGSISIDGNSIQTLDLNWIRNNITLVQQQNVLFSDTISRNIVLGRKDHDLISKAQVKDACQAALLQDTINDLPDGLDTLVGSGGKAMSGGQKQRIAIARARLRDTPIVILDESTSALDYISRSLVMDAIREWRRGKTTIVITHDISQIFGGDYVFVLDKGEVMQRGYKEHLQGELNGLFSSFMANKSQTSFQDDEGSAGGRDPRKSRTKSEGLISLDRRSSSSSVDSLDIQFPRNVQYIPTVFGGSIIDVRYRRPSQNHLSPLTPFSQSLSPASPMSPISSTPKGMELVERSGEATKIDRRRTFRQNNRNFIPMRILQSPANNLQPLIGTQGTPTSPFTRNRVLYRKNEKGDRDIASLKTILATVWPVLDVPARTALVLGFICAFIHAAATPTFSFFFAKLLSTFFITTDRQAQALKWSLCVLFIAIADAVASYFMHYLLEFCGQAWIDRLRTQAFDRILDQPVAWFEDEEHSMSRLAECLDRNAEEMRNLVGRFAGFAFVAGAMTVTALIWSLVVCWKLTFVGMASAPVIYMLTRGFEYVSGVWESRANDAAEDTGSIFMEAFSNIRVVRAFTLEGYFRKKYTKATRAALMVGLKRATYSGLFFGLSDSAILFITALIFYYGAVLVSSAQFTTPDILTVFSMLTFSMANATAIISFIPQINSSRDTGSRLLKLAHLSHTSHERAGITRLSTPLPITLTNLSFTYPSRPTYPALDEINLKISPSTCTAIVGASGSGKSTLASLILKFYPPSSRHGSLTYNGHPSSTVHTSSLRSHIAVVSQSPVLFPTTIAANITYPLPPSSLPQATIISAATRAGIHDFIASLPHGYATPIGDGGQGLSGGQAQRIAIARALARSPKLLVLDEATSSLDVENARLVGETVQRLVRDQRRGTTTTPAAGLTRGEADDDDGKRHGRVWREGFESEGEGEDEAGEGSAMAVLIITHSVEMMRVAERIVVMDRGRVVEMGSWEELMRRRGELRRLVRGGEWE